MHRMTLKRGKVAKQKRRKPRTKRSKRAKLKKRATEKKQKLQIQRVRKIKKIKGGSSAAILERDELFPLTTHKSRIELDDKISEIISFLGIYDIVEYLSGTIPVTTLEDAHNLMKANKRGIYIDDYGLDDDGSSAGVHFKAIVGGQMIDPYVRLFQMDETHGLCQTFAMRAFLDDETGLVGGENNFVNNTWNNIIWLLKRLEYLKPARGASNRVKSIHRKNRTDIFTHGINNDWETSIDEAEKILIELAQSKYALEAIAYAYLDEPEPDSTTREP
jgi:hypothetical protein